jgi:hypothetical protein
MSDLKQRLEEVLHRPARSPADAEQAARAAEALASYLRLEADVARLLGEGEDQRAQPHPAGGRFSGLTLHTAAEAVLKEAKVPLHVRELGKRIKAGGWTHKRSANPRPDQIHYQLAARLPRHPETFVRVAPNTFALKDWGSSAKRPRPRLGLFRGGNKLTARDIGERPDLAATSSEWRSS